MIHDSRCREDHRYHLLHPVFCILYFCIVVFVSSCGYRIIGSQFLPFDTITIKAVQNKTYEPRLEEMLHNALSNEFITQGIEVKEEGGDVVLEATVTSFLRGAIAAVDENVKEQELIMTVDMIFIDGESITEFKSMTSPIEITFQTSGTVSESVAEEEKASDKASREIAKELVSRIILKYGK